MSRIADDRPETADETGAPEAPDAGVSAIEVVVLTPVIIFMIMVIVSLGVVVNAHGQVNAAARDAARAGSIQSTYDEALRQATTAGLADLGSKCTNGNIVTVAYQPPVAPNTVGYLRATVTCLMDLSGFGVFGAKQTVSATFSAPVDPLQSGNLAGP